MSGKKRFHSDSRDNTRNEREFIIQYRIPGNPRLLEFHTKDEKRAHRVARMHVGRKQLVTFKRHVGVGQWEYLEHPKV